MYRSCRYKRALARDPLPEHNSTSTKQLTNVQSLNRSLVKCGVRSLHSGSFLSICRRCMGSAKARIKTRIFHFTHINSNQIKSKLDKGNKMENISSGIPAAHIDSSLASNSVSLLFSLVKKGCCCHLFGRFCAESSWP